MSKPRTKKPKPKAPNRRRQLRQVVARTLLALESHTFRGPLDTLLRTRGAQLWIAHRGKWSLLVVDLGGQREPILRHSRKTGVQGGACSPAHAEFRDDLLQLVRIHRAGFVLGFDWDDREAKFQLLFEDGPGQEGLTVVWCRQDGETRYMTQDEEASDGQG